MFSNLIESGSHARDLKRKGYFFLGTLAFYAVTLLAAGVGSIYAYDARLGAQNDQEIIAILRFPPAPARTETPRREEPRPAAASNARPQIATVVEIVKNAPHTPNPAPARLDTPVLQPGVPVRIGATNVIPPAPGGGSLEGERGGAPQPSTGGHGLPRVEETETALPPPAPTPAVRATPQPQPPQIKKLSSEVLSGKAYHKPAPPYPELARKAGASGPVAVQILVDEQGRVVSAEATGGHPLLRQAAMRAAFQARFTPTTLGGQPVKVTGVITYNFVLQ